MMTGGASSVLSILPALRMVLAPELRLAPVRARTIRVLHLHARAPPELMYVILAYAISPIHAAPQPRARLQAQPAWRLAQPSVVSHPRRNTPAPVRQELGASPR